MKQSSLPLGSAATLLLLLLLVLDDSLAVDPDIGHCPLHQQQFQKILGYRPDFQLIGNTHELCPDPAKDSAAVQLPPNGNDINATLYSTVAGARRDAINVDCWKLCSQDVECAGYVLFLNVSQCFGVTQRNRSSKYYTPVLSTGLLLDSNAVYFEKICMRNVPAQCTDKLWLFTKIPGTSLVQQGRKDLSVLMTRSRCAESCLLEADFACLSATFVATHRNNLVRSSFSTLPDAAHELGTCTLSAKDKSAQPDAFRVATADEEYIENQCAPRTSESDSCAYETYPHSRLAYADAEYVGLAKAQCVRQCATERRFFCQGISYGWKAGRTRCLVHSEDVISLGPRALLSDWDYAYERRVKCLNVTVMCTRSQMDIRYNSVDRFGGRVYVNGHSDECTSSGKDNQSTLLRIAIGNEERERRCGVLRAYQIEPESHTNRTLLSVLAVVQMNPIVQTQADRLVKVGCIIDNHVHENGQIDDISLASTLDFGPTAAGGGTRPTNEGSPLFNTTGTAPRVAMRIVDLAAVRAAATTTNTATTTTDVALGQNLELQIHLEPADSPYDIRATNLIARSDTGHSSILLLDPQGCATDAAVFPAMQSRRTATDRMLFARFHAFKFAGSSYVNFEVVIRFCRGQCEPAQCATAGSEPKITPRARRRRRRRRAAAEVRYGEPVKVIGGAVQRQRAPQVYTEVAAAEGHDVHQRNITERDQIHVDSNEIVSQRVLGTIANEILAADGHSRNATGQRRQTWPPLAAGQSVLEATVPLRLQLSVRVPDAAANSESLIFADSRGEQLFVAGAGAGGASLDSGYMCVNRVFVILLLVLWLVVQAILIAVCCIVVRRYKRLAEAEEDQRALQKAAYAENFAFGDAGGRNRQVRWADQGRSRVLMYT